MRTFFVYMRLELKRAMRLLPAVAAGAAALAGLLGAAAFLAVETVSGEREIARLQAGVVLPEGDGTAERVISMLGSLDSVESICDLVFVSREDGERQVREGTLDFLMEVPEDLVGAVMDGRNEPVTLLFDGPLSVEEQIFQALAEAGARTLSSAQAGIYAADELCRQAGAPEAVERAEAYLNREYLRYSLDRTVYFRKRQVSAFGEVPAKYHYGAAGAVFFLLLSGIPAAGLFDREKTAGREALKRLGIGPARQTAARVLCVALLLALAAGILAAAVWAAGLFPWPDGGENPLGRLWEEFAGTIAEKGRGSAGYRIALAGLALFASGALITLCYEAAGTRAGGMIALAGLTVGMMAVSGGILPEVFLPSGFQAVSPYLPTTVLMDGIKRFFLMEVDWRAAALLGVTGAAAFGGAVLAKGVRR